MKYAKKFRDKYGHAVDISYSKPIPVDSADLCAMLDMAEEAEKKPNTIYIVTSGNEFQQMKKPFYLDKQKACDALKDIVKSIRSRMGVDVIVDKPDRFEFLLGWEESHVVWKIIEVEVK